MTWGDLEPGAWSWKGGKKSEPGSKMGISFQAEKEMVLVRSPVKARCVGSVPGHQSVVKVGLFRR